MPLRTLNAVLIALGFSAAPAAAREVHGAYRFRASHRVAGLFDFLSSSSPQGGPAFDAFLAGAACPTGPAPAAAEVQALASEMERIRQAFLQP